PEAVDDPLLHVLRDAGAGERRTEQHRLGEDPRDEELAVARAGHVDRVAEHVREQQHEHDRRQQHEHQHLWDAGDLDDVALGDDRRVGRHHVDRVHDNTPSASVLDPGVDPLCGAVPPTGSPAPTRSPASRSSPSPSPSVDSARCPVRERNTSSSVGRRNPTSLTPTEQSPSCRSTGMRVVAPPEIGATSRRDVTSTSTSPMDTSTITDLAVSSWSGSATITSMRSPPTWVLRWSAVPRAMARPWSMTTISSARWSASSRYWVVSSSVVPLSTSSRMTRHRSMRLRGSRPVVGSSRNSTGGSATSAQARSSRRRMPPE